MDVLTFAVCLSRVVCIPCVMSGPMPSSSKPEPPKPLTGFRSALEHTGIPRSVLTWKPRLPSRNWSIFLTVTGTLYYLYYDDRKQCRIITEETLKKVEHMGKEPLTGGSLAEVRKVKVYGARCAEDGDDDRALRYFRKYMKVSLFSALESDYSEEPPFAWSRVGLLTTFLAISSRSGHRLRVPARPSHHPRLYCAKRPFLDPVEEAPSSRTRAARNANLPTGRDGPCGGRSAGVGRRDRAHWPSEFQGVHGRSAERLDGRCEPLESRGYRQTQGRG